MSRTLSRLDASNREDLDREADFVAAAQAGDRRAFDLLARPLRSRLHAHCYRMLGALEDADDAVQETLIRAWRHLGGYEPRTSITAWLYRIATNVCLNEIRQRGGRGSGSELLLDPYPDRLVSDLDALDPSASSELRESIHLAFTAAELGVEVVGGDGQHHTVADLAVAGYTVITF